MNLIVEGYRRDPRQLKTPHNLALVDIRKARDRFAAKKHIKEMWLAGLWVEVYREKDGELMAGTISPNKDLPNDLCE